MTTQYQNKTTFVPKKEEELKHKQEQDKYGTPHSIKEKELGNKKPGTFDRH